VIRTYLKLPLHKFSVIPAKAGIQKG